MPCDHNSFRTASSGLVFLLLIEAIILLLVAVERLSVNRKKESVLMYLSAYCREKNGGGLVTLGVLGPSGPEPMAICEFDGF